MHRGKWWHRLPSEDVLIRVQQIVPVDSLQANIVKKYSRAVGVNVPALWTLQQSREVMPGQTFDGRRTFDDLSFGTSGMTAIS
jgi:hypothetical protein